ncbi:MAG TPA: histidine triad nucleotide-binding protein [Acidobacteriota bacterium]|nr:histidine triad nucleotide-binding protein [Acidobacteriota bacterium]
MPDDCLFCRIAAGEVPAKIVLENEQAVAFEDVNPQAPTHILLVPRKHIATLNELQPEDEAVVGRLLTMARDIALARGHAAAGYRTVFNCNADAGQTVFHLHLHMLGGRKLSWPPG